MAKLKILLLSYAYPPQKYPRSIQISHIVQYLQDEFSLKVITACPENTGDPSLLTFTPLHNVEYADDSFLTQFIKKSKGDRLKKAILPDTHYPWHFDLYKKAIHVLQTFNADIVLTCGQPMSTHITGLKLKKRFPHIRWLAHFSDPWIDNLYNDYNTWTRFVNKYYQNAVFRNANTLIFTSTETISLVTQSYPQEIKFKSLYLPNAFNQDLYIQKEIEPQKQTLFKIRYIGNFYGNRQPNCLFEALRRIPKNFLETIQIELIGSFTTSVNDLILKYNLEKTVFTRASIPYLDSLRLLQQSDLLLIIDAPTDISPFLPSKLVDYIGANKPIFGITPFGTSQQLIEEMGFLVANPNTPDEIAKKLMIMIEKIKNKTLKPISENIRHRYSIKTIGKQMSNVLKNLNRKK